jgi:hypothetical protein
LAAAFGLGIAGVSAARYEIWFAFAAAVLVSDLVAKVSTQRAAGRGVGVAWALAASACALGAGTLLWTTSAAAYQSLATAGEVSAAARIAASNPHARILPDESTGAALLWLDPQLAGHIAIDNRDEIYQPRTLTSWIDFYSAKPRTWRSMIGRSNVMVVDSPPLAARVSHLPGWRVVYRDPTGLVAVRTARLR